MSEEREISELAKAEAQEMLRQAGQQFEKTKATMMLFIGTPHGCKAIKADPKAAERAKRYLWNCIEQNQANDRRAE